MRSATSFAAASVTDWGLQNATRFAVHRLFRGRPTEFGGRHLGDLNRYGGMDFNINPMSFAELQIGAPLGLNPERPEHWILCVVAEVVERTQTIHGFADRLIDLGYGGTPITCDPSGAQRNSYRASHGVAKSSTHAKELTRRGLYTVPCHLSRGGEPYQPPILDRINVVHKLQRETLTDRDGREWPRFMISEACEKTIDALRSQESDHRGIPIKEVGTESDRKSGPIDAFTYGAWPAFQAEYYRSIKVTLS